MSAISTEALRNAGLSGVPQAKKRDELGQEAFLKLMTAQLSNQDPFKPMESGEFLTQIAQFSQVQGIQGLQNSFSDFAAAMTPNQNLQAAALMGHSALIPSETVELTAEGGASGAVDVPQNAADAQVGIYDASGQLIRRIGLGAQPAGYADYDWDGLTDEGVAALPGNYRVLASAIIGGSQTDLTHLASARIESVTLGRAGEEPRVSLAGVGEAPLSQLHQIR